ncbi:MAG: hypothetical protein M0P22_06265 [Methanoculleus sp.]|nr:hypothetical protein [Methanoculleus sp.]
MKAARSDPRVRYPHCPSFSSFVRTMAAPIAAITKRTTYFSGIPPIGLIHAPGSSMKSVPGQAGWTRMTPATAIMTRNPLEIGRPTAAIWSIRAIPSAVSRSPGDPRLSASMQQWAQARLHRDVPGYDMRPAAAVHASARHPAPPSRCEEGNAGVFSKRFRNRDSPG